MKRFIAGAALALLLLTGCGPSWSGPGVVVEKQYTPEADGWTSGGYAFDSTGKYVYVGPQYWHTDDSYILLVVADDGGEHVVEVSKFTYFRCSEGARFVEGSCSN